MTSAAIRPVRRAALFATLWIVSYFAARGVLERAGLPGWIRLFSALVPVPLFGAFLRAWMQVLRSLDELQRRIHLEALAIAFSLGLLLLTSLALLQRATTLSFENWSYAHVWIYFPIFYFVAIPLVSRRYSAE